MLSLLLSLKEDGSEGWAAEGGDGRKEWRTVSERVMEAIRYKADELDVNPEKFYQNTGR